MNPAVRGKQRIMKYYACFSASRPDHNDTTIAALPKGLFMVDDQLFVVSIVIVLIDIDPNGRATMSESRT